MEHCEAIEVEFGWVAIESGFTDGRVDFFY